MKSLQLVFFCGILTICSVSQMVDPSIDRGDKPFSYFSQSTDIIGLMDAPVGTLVSPEGYLFAGYGQLMFFTENSPQPAVQRVKTLYHGYLPAIIYAYHEGAIEYQVCTTRTRNPVVAADLRCPGTKTRRKGHLRF